MNNTTKTFRLFISSTFSDFQKEREVLQTKIFPEISEYCSIKGYTFQPIDLRWGVSNEAQLDQKALDMCIKEVQSCKIHDYPNFLIMLGDRYGWIPLPNIIEKNEFELLLKNITSSNKEFLNSWYTVDKNQLPVSYILKQRENEYVDYIKWLEIENKLRDILQDAVSNSDLDNNIKNKYFISATESEAIEGILPYSNTTDYQKELLNLIPKLEQIDHKHIFGFFRKIKKETIKNNKYISNDYDKAQDFKQKLEEQLLKENTLNITTSQITADTLEEEYLQEFIFSIVKFIKKQVDKQIQNDTQNKYTALELEKLQQKYFLDKKIENFLGQENILNKIQEYMLNDISTPLIINGVSGIGKSSIIAKAIEDTSNISNKKIIYRFVGATPNSTTSKDLLSSILEELNIAIEDEKNDDMVNQLLTDMDKEENSFIAFSHKVHKEIMGLTDDIIIFIDAVDQITNDDQFLWLPNNLPSNVKIIVSALKDRDYKEDSKYFNTLKNKIPNFTEIEPYNKPIELLELLLYQQNRTLQEDQKEYFLNQYNQVKSPLYVYMAANQIIYWQSSDIVDNDITLSLSQKDIVKIFIKNLTSMHHHDKSLVQKVFGYIIASKDGLSEYEILELLNTDKEFIKTIAPDTWHTNTTQELPLVIWTRLYGHIKPFLSIKNQDNQELLYFFHREFVDVIKNQSNQQEEYENIIKATQQLIEKNQDKEFDSNRWGKLYALLLGEYFFKYKDEDKVKEFCKFISYGGYDENWLLLYIEEIQKTGFLLNLTNKLQKALSYRNIIYFTLKSLYKNSINWSYLYIQSAHNVASTLLKQNKIKESLAIEEENLIFVKKAISEPSLLLSVQPHIRKVIKNADITGLALYYWIDSQIKILFALSSCHLSLDNLKKAIELDKRALELSEHFYNLHKDNRFFWRNNYLIALGNLADSLYQNSELDKAIEFQEKCLDILENNYDFTTGYLIEDYARALNSLSIFLLDSNPIKSKKLLEQSHEILSKLFNQNPNRYSVQIHNINSNKISIGLDNKNNELNNLLIKFHEEYKDGSKNEAFKLLSAHIKIVKNEYDKDNGYWADKYVRILIIIGEVLSGDSNFEEASKYQEEAYFILSNNFTNNIENWADLYTKALNNLANTYTYLNKKNESYLLNRKNLDISTKLFQSDQQKWFKAYYYALENMASTYMMYGEFNQEKECRDKIEELESNPSFQLVADVIKNKSIDKRIKYFDYIFKGFLMLGIFFIFYFFIFQ
ncbi:MAG: hypothetical protein DRG78_01840 [Epsilonproteobacteria bacterium]|nr:MAG: hypothetical protein DRG78_01840 [Campylobacterota bacterium]